MRKYYLDNLRCLTVALVVVYHVIYMFCGVIDFAVIGPFRDSQPQDGLLYLLYPWFMQLLFLVAGMSSRYSLEKRSVREFVRSRTQKLLVPSTLGVLVFGWMQGWISMSMANAFASIPAEAPGAVRFLIMTLSGTGVLWFAQLLWFFSMLLALVRRFESGRLYAACEKLTLPWLVLLVIPVYLSGLVLNNPVVVVYRFGIYGFSFFLGYFVFAHEAVIERLSKAALPLSLAALALGILSLVLHFGADYANAPTVSSVEAVVFGWAACLALLGGMKRWGDREYGLVKYLAPRSYGLYILHYLPLSAAALLLHRAGFSALPSYLLTAAAGFGGALILYEIVSRIPVVRYLVLGRKGARHVSR